MSEQKQIEQLKEANETWRKQWASERYEVEQLKAQVNCLREELQHVANCFFEVGNDDYIFKLLKATPEQCLAEVKAKAVEGVANDLRTDEDYHHNDNWYINYLMNKADLIREQVK